MVAYSQCGRLLDAIAGSQARDGYVSYPNGAKLKTMLVGQILIENLPI